MMTLFIYPRRNPAILVAQDPKLSEYASRRSWLSRNSLTVSSCLRPSN